MTMIKNVITEQFKNPSDQFVKALINKNIYNGIKTQAVLDKFKVIIQKAFDEYINDTLTTPTGKPVGFSLPSVARNRTSFSDFGVTSIILFE